MFGLLNRIATGKASQRKEDATRLRNEMDAEKHQQVNDFLEDEIVRRAQEKGYYWDDEAQEWLQR